jgi:hypothetical protein
MINDQHFSGLAIDRMNALRVAAGGVPMPIMTRS